jgi:hypothetical protein
MYKETAYGGHHACLLLSSQELIQILIKFNRNIMSLEATPNAYFVIPYNSVVSWLRIGTVEGSCEYGNERRVLSSKV